MDRLDGDLEYVLAHQKYRALRRIAFEEALKDARVLGFITADVVMTELDRVPVGKWTRTWRGTVHWTGSGGWPWDLLRRRFASRPRSFHCAVWCGNVLCGFGIGRVSKGRTRLTLHYIEGSPDPKHPLRGNIMLLIVTAAIYYARAVGAERVLLKDPLQAVQPLYARFGFGVAETEKGIVYFERDLG